MDLKQELINRLGVPENWDKYDYQTQRYSFDDMQEVLEDIVERLTIPVGLGQSELLDLLTEIANSDKLYSNTRHRMIARKLLKSNCG